mgnify:FL=1
MTDLSIGDAAPDFTAPATLKSKISLSDYKGQKLVLYFYPKDDTSGCTKEACGFEENLAAFNDAGVAVVGVSKDPIKSHEKFTEKYGLTFPLISDEEGAICEAYGVWVEKSMYGRKYMGIERATFLIDADGNIEQIWRKVKVPGHVDAVIAAATGQAEAA